MPSSMQFRLFLQIRLVYIVPRSSTFHIRFSAFATSNASGAFESAVSFCTSFHIQQALSTKRRSLG
jgi:hypothetical protein